MPLHFFCWLLGYVPGGSLFNQLNQGDKTLWSLSQIEAVHQTKKFLLNKAARIITIVAVIKLCCNLPLLDNGRERKVKDTRTNNKDQTQKKNTNKQTTNTCP